MSDLASAKLKNVLKSGVACSWNMDEWVMADDLSPHLAQLCFTARWQWLDTAMLAVPIGLWLLELILCWVHQKSTWLTLKKLFSKRGLRLVLSEVCYEGAYSLYQRSFLCKFCSISRWHPLKNAQQSRPYLYSHSFGCTSAVFLKW